MVVLIGLVMALFILLWYSWAASVLWGWFMVPIFQLPALTMWHVTGIATVFAVFRPHSPGDIYKSEKKKELDPIKTTMLFMGPAISLGWGWLIKTYMI